MQATEKIPSLIQIKNAYLKLDNYEKKISKIMEKKGFDGAFEYRPDENFLCYSWCNEKRERCSSDLVSIIHTQKELNILLNASFDKAYELLEEKSI